MFAFAMVLINECCTVETKPFVANTMVSVDRNNYDEYNTIRRYGTNTICTVA